MGLSKSDNNARNRGYVLTAPFAILAFYLLMMAKQAEPMAEPSVVCTRTLTYLTDLEGKRQGGTMSLLGAAWLQLQMVKLTCPDTYGMDGSKTRTIWWLPEAEYMYQKMLELKNCTVLEGGLKFLSRKLPDATSAAYAEMLERYALPKLREISGFLVLHESKGLQSLSDLFPNLSVIRGENPLDGHLSLMITKNEDLKRIGLKIAVLNGSVRIHENPKLCPESDFITELKKYSPNIEVDVQRNLECVDRKIWYGGLTFSEHKKIYHLITNIKNNSTIKDCLNGKIPCPRTKAYVRCRHFATIESVPTWPSPPSTSCHQLCLGGCIGPSPSDCFLCRAFQHNETCVEKCPHEKRLSVPSHCCVDEAECKQRNLLHDFGEMKGKEENARFMVENNTCVLGCPKPYIRFYKYGVLECNKVREGFCFGRIIKNIADLETLHGCIYTTSLEIRMGRCDTYNISGYEEDLEINLGSIQEIEGVLHIQRFHGLRNLHFLKNLRSIIHPSDAKFTLLIDDNASLTQLFAPNVTSGLKIQAKAGSIVISNNPLLCSGEIKSLQEKIMNGTPLLDSNNGRRTQCDKSAPLIRTTANNFTATSALIGWETNETLPSVFSTVYFRPAPGNTTYSILPPSNPWLKYWESVDNVGNNSDRPFVLNSLMSGTRYAFFVEVTGDKGVLQVSDFDYFETEQRKPNSNDRPCSVTVWPYPTLLSSESSLKVEWAMPQRKLFSSHFVYLITGEYLRDTASPCSSQKFQRSEICAYDTALKQFKPGENPNQNRRQIIESCSEFSETLDSLLAVTDPQTLLEKLPDTSNVTYTSHDQMLAEIVTENRTDNFTNRLQYFAIIANTEAVVVKNLIPFGQYAIKVYACLAQKNNDVTDQGWESRCSSPGYGVGRSSALGSADKLIFSPIATPSNYSPTFVLQWGKARVTNSLVWYTVNVTNENKTKHALCSEKDEYRFDDMPFGLYTICVTVESFLKTGETRCISYSVESQSWRNFLIFFGIAIAIITLGFIARRIRQSRFEDQIVLLSEESFDTHVRFSDLPDSDMETIPI